MSFVKTWLHNFLDIMLHELRGIFKDVGVLIIFFVGGLGYPIVYSLVYHNGILEDTPIAVVDDSADPYSRRYIRELDATREVSVAYSCVNMEEARSLLQKRKVNGIVYFPRDFGEKVVRGETAKLSIYADMSSFLYYKNLLMGANFVMLDEIKNIQIERFSAAGYSGQTLSQLVEPMKYEDNNPYNRAFSYGIFFLSAALLLVIQQTMFYGMSLRAGTMREESHSPALLPSVVEGSGVGRVVLGRGAAYWLLYMGIGMYIAYIIPAAFGLPQRGDFRDIFILLLFFITDCVLFCSTWSSLITRRETVFILFLFMSPVALFLTGFSWPTSAFPAFWKYFSYIFPSTFGCQAFINLNTAGGDLSTVRDLIAALAVQTIVYYVLSSVAIYVENWIIRHKELLQQKRNLVEERIGRGLGDRVSMDL
ncbi:MAG: ABC transporter permease [Bacteroidia bacterium]|nr:ABC transporter permease [Bacteroidia bacterium]